MNFLRVVQAVLRRDISNELRRPDVLITIGMFGLLTVVTFVFAFAPGERAREEIVPGCLWTAYIFAGMLGLGRSAARDAQDGGTVGLLLSPADRGAVFLGKVCSNALFMFVGEAVVLLPAIFWFDLGARHFSPMFFLIIFMGTVGFVAISSILSVVSQKSRLREVMLPVILLPLLMVLVNAAVHSTAIVMAPGPNDGLGDWLQLLLGFDVIFGVAGFLLYGFVLEE